MSLWQPRSLQQLVLIGVLVALAPLGLATLFTIETLAQLADENLQTNQTVVSATRLGQEVQRDVLELERRARQYLALSDSELADLFEREKRSLREKLDTLQSATRSYSRDIDGLSRSLETFVLPSPEELELPREEDQPPEADTAAGNLTQSPEARVAHEFSVINDQASGVRVWLLAWVDKLLESSARAASGLIDDLTMQLGVLAAATLALLLLLGYWVNKPMKELTREIHQLGTAGLSHPIEISGPSELQAVGTELEWLRQSLQESQQQKDQFLRHISHELKTPLASLREGTELLADQVTGHLSQQQLEIVEIVRQNGIELQRLIENLIDYNRLPAQELAIECFELERLWQELISNHSLTLSKKGLQLVHRGAVRLWSADRDKLRTSLDNLLSNAVSYTPEGGEIDVAWRRQDDTLVIDVANSGEPIPEEDVERVFEPFFQSAAKRSGPIKGSGIGLSVARECIEAQGGALALIRHPRLPVCFRLLCPEHS